MPRSKDPPIDLELCRPERAVDSETDGELSVVLRPRFFRGPLAWWLQPRLRNKFFRVHLDAIGTFVWERCDGQTTVDELVELMTDHFGDPEEQMLDRLQKFLFELERGSMIRMVLPDMPPASGDDGGSIS